MKMTEIEELRKKIEVITIEMLSLLKTRTEIAQKIGKIKNQQGMSVSNESRENELRELIKKQCQTIDFDSNTGKSAIISPSTPESFASRQNFSVS